MAIQSFIHIASFERSADPRRSGHKEKGDLMKRKKSLEIFQPESIVGFQRETLVKQFSRPLQERRFLIRRFRKHIDSMNIEQGES